LPAKDTEKDAGHAAALGQEKKVDLKSSGFTVHLLLLIN
jgi:hypothetical protein